MDLISFIADIPSVVEGFVKTARVLIAYRGLDTKYAETLQDAIYYAEKLDYLSYFIDGAQFRSVGKRESAQQTSKWSRTFQKASKGPRRAAGGKNIDDDVLSVESQRILYNLFQNAVSALRVAQKIVLEWAIRLDLIDSSTTRLLVAKLALSLSDRFIRLPDMKRNKALAKMKNKLVLLAFGYIQVEDAVSRLRHWLTELHDILMASPNLHARMPPSGYPDSRLVAGKDDDLRFVTIARERESRNHPVQRIDDDLFKSACTLDMANTELFYIRDGRFEGCLIDRRNIIHFLEEGKVDLVLSDTERMARLFAEEHDDLGHNITASIGILPCCGFSTSDPEFHDLVFRLPSGTQKPRTLRSLLMEEPRHMLDERLKFSIKLASAVLIVHSLGILHKDIRPDSIILIDPIDPRRMNKALGEPYLLAFNQSRFQSSRSIPITQAIREGRGRLWNSFYRHPRHFSTCRHLPYETRDDVYSLGLCLLEVGIWRSLFTWNTEYEILECDKAILDFTDSKYFGEVEGYEAPGRAIPPLRHRDVKAFAEDKIPIAMGAAFKDIVIECLTFGEEPTVADMPERRKDNQKFLQNQSVNFVQNVLTKLRDLKLN